MNTPHSRAEFERNLNLLCQKIKDGKFHAPSSLLEGFLRLRFLPNRRIDFLSVDEMARLNANMMNNFNEDFFQEQPKIDENSTNVSTDAEDRDNQITKSANCK